MEMRGMMGERLGVIGQASDQLPQWKQDFLSKPSASVRKGIAWVCLHERRNIISG